MTPPDSSGEFEPPRHSLAGRIAGLIEHACIVGARLSIPLFVPLGGLFLLYTVGGSVLLFWGFWSPSYEFLSLTTDVYFAWLAFLTGSNICLGTGSLIGLAFLTEGEGRIHNEVSILASFIGFGFGAGVIRLTYQTVLSTVV